MYARAAKLKNLRLVRGLQMHIGSQLTSVGRFLMEAVTKRFSR